VDRRETLLIPALPLELLGETAQFSLYDVWAVLSAAA